MNDIISSNLDFDEKNAWRTDPLIFNAMDREFDFNLDAAASDDNYLVETYLTVNDDALSINWSTIDCRAQYYEDYVKNVWINPPYGRGYIKKFMQKCIEQKAKGVASVMLVPATLDAQWLPINDISEIRIITGGRLSFYHPTTNKKVNGNTRGSMFVVFRPTKTPCFMRLVDRDELLDLGK